MIELMRQLLRTRLFTRPASPLGPWQIIRWWEARRLPYNVIVGTTGLICLLIILAAAILSERVVGEPVGMPDPPLLAIVAVVAYGVMANICYTGGWVIELLARRLWGPQAGSFGEIAFALGVAFSVLLTLAPAAVTVVAAAITLTLHALGLQGEVALR